ncbi:MAG: hypothetical protein HRT35_19805 [Algicola sp.]|nr:hypothetical protein [Algicola sp.]
MKVENIVNQFTVNTMPSIHKGRQKSFAAAVCSTLVRNELTVTAVGRGIDGDAEPKAKIKRFDRLCSNPNLAREKNSIYATICTQWIPANARPVILVDWSDLDDHKNAFLISATQSYDGRPITLYQEVHSIETKETRQSHNNFLTQLKGFNASKSYKINRIEILMLIAAVAALILIIIGTAVEQAGMHLRYQANTEKKRRVLSLHFLGCEVIKDAGMNVTFAALGQAVIHMRKIISMIDRSLWAGKGNPDEKCQPSLPEYQNNMFH